MGSLIVNADDYGISHEVNLAIEKGINENIIDRASLMVNMPFAEEAVEMAIAGRYLSKIGLHINLVEGNPLTCDIRKTWLCENGKFNGKISDKKYKKSVIADRNVLMCIEKEINAQMKKYISWNMPLLHADSHQHSHIKPSIFPVVMKCAENNGFTSIRLASLIKADNPKISTKIYKTHINYRIKEFNKTHTAFGSNYPQIDIGCAYDSLRKQIEIDDGSIFAKNVEAWFHPSIKDGVMVNLFSKEQFDEKDIASIKVLFRRVMS